MKPPLILLACLTLTPFSSAQYQKPPSPPPPSPVTQYASELNWLLFQTFLHGNPSHPDTSELAFRAMANAMILDFDITEEDIPIDDPWKSTRHADLCDLKTLIELCIGNDPYSLYEMGLNYHMGSVMNQLFFIDAKEGQSGIGFCKDQQQANRLFRAAASILQKRASLGDAKAKFYISFLNPYLAGEYESPYYRGGAKETNSEGLQQLHEAALWGYRHAIEAWAYFLYRAAAENRDGTSSVRYDLAIKIIDNSLSYNFDNRKIGTWELEQTAFKWMQKWAVSGNYFAMERLAEYYEQGIGTEKDKYKALKWYKAAKWQGGYYVSPENIRRLSDELEMRNETDKSPPPKSSRTYIEFTPSPPH